MPLLEGNFGRVIDEIDEDPIEFMFCDKKFTASSSLFGFAFMRLQHRLKHSKGAETLADDNEAIYEFLRGIFDEDDMWKEFQDLILEHRVPITELFRLTNAIGTAMAGRPTQRSSDSSTGPPATRSGRNSKRDSSNVSTMKKDLIDLPEVVTIDSTSQSRKKKLPVQQEYDFGEDVTESTVRKLQAIG